MEYIHVGDSLSKDVMGARAAGWKGVLLDRDGGNAERRDGDGHGGSEGTSAEKKDVDIDIDIDIERVKDLEELRRRYLE